jgi:simple sugar transport system substrate-binding protein
VASQPDGIALTVSDPIALRKPILRAINSGIPIIAYHAGSGPIQDDLPYLTYLGMDNYQGGYLGGQRLIRTGARAGVCINQAPELAALQTRCKGFQSAFTEAGLTAEVLNTSTNAAQAQSDIQQYAQTHTEVNAFLTTGPGSAMPFYAWLQASGHQTGEILHGTFELNAEINTHIANGVTLFGIDQQPYLQGYQAVFWLTMITRYGFKPASPVSATGPHFVDKTNLNAQANPKRPVNLIFVQHAMCAWDTYWCVVERGIRDAAQERGVQVYIWGPEKFDLTRMTAQINDAVAAKPDGMAVTVPDPKVLHAPILQAIQAGFPVVAYATGAGLVKDDLPYLTFIGTDSDAEYQGGYLAALRLIHAGGRTGVCVNHQMGHMALDARCRGMLDAFAKEELKAEVLDCSGDAEQALTILQEYAQAHPEVNAFLTMGAGEPGAISFYRYLENANRPRGEVLHGTFDLSLAVATAVEDGTSLFAVDGQPYLLGYRAVMVLTLALRQNIWPAEPITPTGPGFVDLSNIAIVKQLAGLCR